MGKIDIRIEDWKRKLIDLTRRNRLLFFKPARSSSLKVIEPSPSEVFRRLTVEEKPWKFFVPFAENEEQDKFGPDLMLPLSANAEEDQPKPEKPVRRPDELLCQTREAQRLRVVLRNLYRRSRSDFEERGVRILYVTFGTLEWRETPESELIRSPLLFVPTQLLRASARDPFEISAVDEEIVANPALEAKLRNDVRLELPSLPDDWEETELDSYLAEIERQVRPRGWNVSRECWIGLFSFHKLVMHQDLNSHANLIKQHPIVRGLAGESGITNFANGNLPDPQDLDNLVHPKESYTVVDADSSQLACIEAVKRGVSLVLQGPPGTGKSQTITNLIAESIAAGRKVLFVSEKMAALEIVYKRLRDANLGHYCLELHSHKANKREIVAEIYQCYRESRQPKTVMTELEFQQLVDRRRQLNDYVNALHLAREPLGKSAYSVLGELAELERVPFVAPGDIHPETLTPVLLDRAVQLARRLGPVWKVVVDGERFPWLGCTVTSYGPETRTTFQALTHTCEDAFTKLVDEGQRMADAFGLPAPTCLANAEWLLQTGNCLCEGPGIEVGWLRASELGSLISEAQRYSNFSSRRRTLKEELGQHYTEAFFQLPATLKEGLSKTLEAVSISFGREVHHESVFVSQRNGLLHWVRDLMDRSDDWVRDAGTLCDLLGLPAVRYIEDLHRLVQIAEFCESDDRPDRKWLDPLLLEEVDGALPNLRRNYKARAASRTHILQEYEESFLSLDFEQLVETFSTRYVSPLRWLKPGFYSIRRKVRRRRQDGKNPSDILKDLRAAWDLVQLEAKIEVESSHTRELLGVWYRGYETNFTRVEKAIGVTRKLLELAGGNPPEKLLHQACFGSFPSAELRQATKRLKESLVAWEEGTDAYSKLLPLARLPFTGLPLNQSRLEDILAWAKEFVPPLEEIVAYLDQIESSLRSRVERPVAGLLADLWGLAKLRELESQMLEEADQLQITYGSHFAGLDTDWDSVLGAIEWARRLREHLGTEDLPERLLEIASQGAAAAPSVDSLRNRIREFREAFAQLTARFNHADAPLLNGHPLVECAFDSIGGRLLEMRERVEEIRDWVDYKSVENDFQQANLQKLRTEIVQRPFLQPADLSDIVRRALLQAWIDWLFKVEPTLGRFRAQDHETLIAEFRELDCKHSRFGAYRVISQAERWKPTNLVLQPGGEAITLVREANKKKRHLPIRRLFAQIPNLLTGLKPCLLMSPLSVSQFIDPRQLHFDLVIFDEASQICSEDAVGTIYRGRQLVVCGDNKQLPPTAFFEQGMSDEFENQDAVEAFDVFDSILDECASIGMPSSWLRWHYRSRHESLIAFSNRRFYDDRLVTFPASRQEHPERGIKFVHVPDGIYDRGGRRDNPREAEEVIELVVQHLFQSPSRSLGVVAFSVAQMNAIEDRLEYHLRKHPELEHYFKPDRPEHCFVKNLENVQGDERDVIIFSVGYGRDQQGRLTMNFGPLNLAGGERRLNVAVTRAREKVIVVSSIRAADFDLSTTQKPGVLALYHYLDYAERGLAVLALRHPGSSGDFESPLERDVAGAIRALGYDVVPQVGCSSFRIDLGVVDPAEPGRFILGVECDGVTYHSAYTARDRDRLREEILKDLGWRIHRVWSPDWVTRRETEIRRLRDAIEQARVLASCENEVSPTSNASEAVDAPVAIRTQTPLPENNDTFASWAVPYKACRPQTPPPQGIEFHAPAARQTLARMLKEVVDVEGPIHLELATRRLADRWGLQRVGSRMMDAVKKALRLLTSKNLIERRDDFLWPQQNDFTLQVRRPDPNDEATIRKIELIPREELELAIQYLVRDAISIPDDQVLTQVARVFGFDRTGANIRERMERILGQMLQEGILVRKGERVSLGQDGGM